MAQDLEVTIDWVLLAKQHPILSKIPQFLRGVATRVLFAAGHVLFRRGTRPKGMLFVISGEVRLTRYTPGGQQVILQRSRSGFVAEASMDAKAYHCDIVAVEEGSVVMFPIAAFRDAIDQEHEFRQVWISSLASEVRRLRVQNERLHLNRATDRIIHYLESEGRNGVVRLSQTRKTWAMELGLSHEALYRTLATMTADGSILIQGETISLATLA